mgnify:CR=1 FL=1
MSTQKNFDQADLNAGNIKVTDAEIEEAYALVDRKLVEIIRKSTCKYTYLS